MRINADDFGLDKSVNSAIYKLAKLGKIDSVSAIVNADNFDSALLKKINNLGVSVGIHFNLISGGILSTRLADQLNSKVFLGENFWLLQKDLKSFIPAIEQEFEEQLNLLRSIVKVTYADFHTIVPFLIDDSLWGIYKKVCEKNNLKYRGSNITHKYTSFVSLVHIQKIKQTIKLRSFYKILIGANKNFSGSFKSDYSYNCWDSILPKVSLRVKKVPLPENYELIVHVADPNIKSKSLFMYKNKCRQFEVLSKNL